jgi:hypothetical protein
MYGDGCAVVRQLARGFDPRYRNWNHIIGFRTPFLLHTLGSIHDSHVLGQVSGHRVRPIDYLREFPSICSIAESLAAPFLVFENERNFHKNAVLGDFTFVVDDEFLVLNPRGFDVLQRFVCADKSLPDGRVETFI